MYLNWEAAMLEGVVIRNTLGVGPVLTLGASFEQT